MFKGGLPSELCWLARLFTFSLAPVLQVVGKQYVFPVSSCQHGCYCKDEEKNYNHKIGKEQVAGWRILHLKDCN